MINLLSCTHSKEPSDLIYGFRSYANFSSVKEELKLRGANYEVLENSTLPKGDKRPRFDIIEIRVDGLVKGTKEGAFFSFYNDQLVKIWFYYADLSEAKPVRDSMRNSDLIFKVGLKEKLSRNVQLTISESNENMLIITFEDINLAKSRWDWVMKHS